MHSGGGSLVWPLIYSLCILYCEWAQVQLQSDFQLVEVPLTLQSTDVAAVLQRVLHI